MMCNYRMLDGNRETFGQVSAGSETLAERVHAARDATVRRHHPLARIPDRRGRC